jgi:hypothetical protein
MTTVRVGSLLLLVSALGCAPTGATDDGDGLGGGGGGKADGFSVPNGVYHGDLDSNEAGVVAIVLGPASGSEGNGFVGQYDVLRRSASGSYSNEAGQYGFGESDGKNTLILDPSSASNQELVVDYESGLLDLDGATLDRIDAPRADVWLLCTVLSGSSTVFPDLGDQDTTTIVFEQTGDSSSLTLAGSELTQFNVTNGWNRVDRVYVVEAMLADPSLDETETYQIFLDEAGRHGTVRHMGNYEHSFAQGEIANISCISEIPDLAR